MSLVTDHFPFFFLLHTRVSKIGHVRVILDGAGELVAPLLPRPAARGELLLKEGIGLRLRGDPGASPRRLLESL